MEELASVKGFKDNLAEEVERMQKQFAEDQEQLMHSSTSKFRANRVFSSPDAFDVSVDEVWVKNVEFVRNHPPVANSTPFGKQLKCVVFFSTKYLFHII